MRKVNTRMIRINDEIQREAANIIRSEVKDPRIGSLTSVIKAETTSDLKYCKIYVSVFGNDEEKAAVMKGLKNASGFMRRLIAQRVNLRITPELIFKLDDSVEYAVRMNKLIDEVVKSLHKDEDEDNEE